MSISVLMSVYKSENPAYLDRALKSVWDDQTLKPNEIVLIEDGPLGSGLSAIVEEWKNRLGEVLVILHNEVNLGLTKSLNKGIRHIRSEYVARMDSDDVSDPLRFERQTAYLKEHPEVDVVGGSLQEFNDEHPNLNVRHYPLTPEESRGYIVKASPLAHPTVMMRRRIFDSGIMYNEKYRTSQDIALWFDLLSRGYKIANVPEVTIYFRRDDAVFKRRNRSKAVNEFKIYMKGIWSLYGFTWKYAYPVARLCFRLLPTSMVKWIYGSSIRKRVVEK